MYIPDKAMKYEYGCHSCLLLSFRTPKLLDADENFLGVSLFTQNKTLAAYVKSFHAKKVTLGYGS